MNKSAPPTPPIPPHSTLARVHTTSNASTNSHSTALTSEPENDPDTPDTSVNSQWEVSRAGSVDSEYPPGSAPGSSHGHGQGPSSLQGHGSPHGHVAKTFGSTSVDTLPSRTQTPLYLPGLAKDNASLIPILAKVEFDIDTMRAAWYAPWARSRGGKTKRRKGGKSKVVNGIASTREIVDLTNGGSGGAERNLAVVDLKLVERMKSPVPFLREMARAQEAQLESSESEEEDVAQSRDGYAQLSDPSESESDDDNLNNDSQDARDMEDAYMEEEMDMDMDPTIRDPLSDVFGTDADTWTDIRASASSTATATTITGRPSIVNLALSAAELSKLPEFNERAGDERRESTFNTRDGFDGRDSSFDARDTSLDEDITEIAEILRRTSFPLPPTHIPLPLSPPMSPGSSSAFTSPRQSLSALTSPRQSTSSARQSATVSPCQSTSAAPTPTPSLSRTPSFSQSLSRSNSLSRSGSTRKRPPPPLTIEPMPMPTLSLTRVASNASSEMDGDVDGEGESRLPYLRAGESATPSVGTGSAIPSPMIGLGIGSALPSPVGSAGPTLSLAGLGSAGPSPAPSPGGEEVTQEELEAMLGVASAENAADNVDDDAGGAGMLGDKATVGEEDDDDVEARRPKTATGVKRTGLVFEDFDLGLDDLDDDDPEDRRKSQFLMRAELDKIEQTLAQFSPRPLALPLADEQSNYLASHGRTKSTLSLSRTNSESIRQNRDVFPPTPRSATFPDPSKAAWPAVPYASLSAQEDEQDDDSSMSPAPPMLALNGVTTAAPRAYMDRRPSHSQADDGRSESAMRKRELNEEMMGMSTPPPPRGTGESPSVIPLSPDPFGRFSSSVYEDGSPTPVARPGGGGVKRSSVRQSGAGFWDSLPVGLPSPLATEESVSPSAGGVEPAAENVPKTTRRMSGASKLQHASRFSVDSPDRQAAKAASDKAAKAGGAGGMNPMKSIRNMWRKSSGRGSVSSMSVPTPEEPVPALPGKERRPSVVARTSKESVRKSVESVRTSLSRASSREGSGRAPSPQMQQLPPSPLPHVQSFNQPPPPHPTRTPPSHPPSRTPPPQPYAAPPPQPNGPPPQVAMHMMKKGSLGANGNGLAPPPMMAAHMNNQHQQHLGLDRFTFNQETPYPIPRRAPPMPSTPVNINAPLMPLSPVAEGQQPPSPGPGLSSDPFAAAPQTMIPPRPAVSRQASTGSESENTPTGSRRPSVARTSSAGSVGKSVPPSPPMPEKTTMVVPPTVVPPLRLSNRTTVSDSDSATVVGDATVTGKTSSKGLDDDDDETRRMSDGSDSRPSFDVNDFEIVSPRGNAMPLSYPYTTMDHDTSR